MTFLNFLFSHQTEAVEAAAPVIVREDFIITDAEEMPIRALLHNLRERTINFVEDSNLDWGATDFEVRGVPTRVKLTEDYDVVYVIDGINTFDLKNAIDMIHELIQF